MNDSFRSTQHTDKSRATPPGHPAEPAVVRHGHRLLHDWMAAQMPEPEDAWPTEDDLKAHERW